MIRECGENNNLLLVLKFLLMSQQPVPIFARGKYMTPSYVPAHINERRGKHVAKRWGRRGGRGNEGPSRGKKNKEIVLHAASAINIHES